MVDFFGLAGKPIKALLRANSGRPKSSSRKAKITVAALSLIERYNAEPRPSTRKRLAAALGVDPAEMVGD